MADDDERDGIATDATDKDGMDEGTGDGAGDSLSSGQPLEHHGGMETTWDVVPVDLRLRQQWLIWRREILDDDQGHVKKVPVDPQTSVKVDYTDPQRWMSFAAAVAAAQQGRGDGIAFALGVDGPFTAIDLDGCRDPETGVLTNQGQDIVRDLDTYTEVSPSGRGLHLWVCGVLPGDQRMARTAGLEMYSAGQFITVTGVHLPGTPTALPPRQTALVALYARAFLPEEGNPTTEELSADLDQTPPLDDAEVVQLAEEAANGDTFRALWAGQWASLSYPSASEADAALCSLLAFFTQDATQLDRLFRHSGLFRPKWDRSSGQDLTYGQRTIAHALATLTATYQPADTQHLEQYTRHYAWQDREETPEQRQALLADMQETIRAQALAHLRRGENRALVIAAPPGVGKSTAVAALGDPMGSWHLNLAWITERHAMVEQVPGLDHYRHIQPCTAENCPDWQLHDALGRRGHNTWPVHTAHLFPCAYRQQFTSMATSAIYQLGHVPTTYPAQHPDGIVIDECNLSNWLEAREVTHQDVVTTQTAMRPDDPAQALLQAVARTLHEAVLDRTDRYGPEVFREIDRQCQVDGHTLVGLVEALADDPRATDLHPRAEVDLAAPDVIRRVHHQPPVVLPHLWHALSDEMGQHLRGGPWNSHLRIGPASDGKSAWSLYITRPRTFTPDTSSGTDPRVPPRVILDATAEKDLVQRLLDAPVKVETMRLDPPPHMQHIAIRVHWRGGIKTYSKTSLVWAHNQARRDRAITEIQEVLRQVDPKGTLRAAGQVGLITFQQCEDDLREALGIRPDRSGHFWAQRGSNMFRDCPVLVVVGTPALREEDIFRMASVLYAHDPMPLVLKTVQETNGTYRFVDDRCQGLADYLTRAELTQCAHRNRPLCYDGRTVVTFCRQDIDFLPATQVITHFPRRLGRERDEERLVRAADWVRAQGHMLTPDTLEAALRAETGRGLRRQKILAWLRAHPTTGQAA